MIKLMFSNEGNCMISKEIFEKIVAKAEKVLGTRKGEIGLILVGDRAIQKLNKKYREIDKPTDVLSFEYEDKMCMGDIFISINTAKKQAREHKHSLQKELEILFKHGLLHLFGLDHKTDAQEKEMEKWAKKI